MAVLFPCQRLAGDRNDHFDRKRNLGNVVSYEAMAP